MCLPEKISNKSKDPGQSLGILEKSGNYKYLEAEIIFLPASFQGCKTVEHPENFVAQKKSEWTIQNIKNFIKIHFFESSHYFSESIFLEISCHLE